MLKWIKHCEENITDLKNQNALFHSQGQITSKSEPRNPMSAQNYLMEIKKANSTMPLGYPPHKMLKDPTYGSIIIKN